MHGQNTTLITGGAGFLGNELARLFKDEGINTVVADSKRRLDSYLIPQVGVEYIASDWPNSAEISKLKNIDSVIHLAWSSNPSSSMQDISLDASTNLLGTLSLLESFRNIPLKKFVFMSSGGTVYGSNPAMSLKESDATNPISSYGITKLACEKYVNLYGARGGFTPINIRLGNPYGVYQLQGTPVGVVASFIRKIFSSEAIAVYGDGAAVRDYIHIDDVSRVIHRLLISDSAVGTYNLGSGIGTSVMDIVNAIESLTLRAVNINHFEERRADVRSVVLNIDRLNNELGDLPLISLEVGIKEMILAMESNLSTKSISAV